MATSVERSTPTRARTRQQLRRTLKEIAAERSSCSHFSAEQVGVIEAFLCAGGWEYRTAYRCPTCQACFVETHAQSTPRSSGSAMV